MCESYDINIKSRVLIYMLISEALGMLSWIRFGPFSTGLTVVKNVDVSIK